MQTIEKSLQWEQYGKQAEKRGKKQDLGEYTVHISEKNFKKRREKNLQPLSFKIQKKILHP